VKVVIDPLIQSIVPLKVITMTFKHTERTSKREVHSASDALVTRSIAFSLNEISVRRRFDRRQSC